MARKKGTDLNYLDSLVNDRDKEEIKDTNTSKANKKGKNKKFEEQVLSNSVENIPGKEEADHAENNVAKVKDEKKVEKEIETPSVQDSRKRKGPNIDLIRKLQQEKLQRAEEEQKERDARKQREKEERERQKILEEQRKKEEEEKKTKEIKSKGKKKRANLERNLINLNIQEEKKEEEKIEKVHISAEEGNKSPICCILGHVDTGKTKILDKLRETNVQGQEAGGITQQIGATFFPLDFLYNKYRIRTKLPGILIIDTPGHESFSNLRSRGSSLCDFAILVVDFFHLLEPQTLESINLLKLRKTPFIVALNKIDKIYGWQNDKSFEEQNQSVKLEFKKGLNETIVKFAEIGLNARLYSENKEPKKFISLVPTSAITGEGLNILINMILKMSETFMKKKVTLSDKFECVVLEVKNVEGFGTTLDVILVDGDLKENDKICVGTSDGPIITKVRTILVPQHCRDAKAKHSYDSVKAVKASMGFKIAANNLERVLTGSKIVKVTNDEEAIAAVNEDLNYILKDIKLQQNGVHVQASTLGSLEALISFLEKEKIPIFSFSIGDVRKQDIKRASVSKTPVMLCFDIDFSKELLDFAKEVSVKVFTAKIIYHLVDYYKEYVNTSMQNLKSKYAEDCIYPFELQILPNCVFTKRSPLVLGVEVIKGKLLINTSVFVKKDGIERLGKIVSIENNKKAVTSAVKGDKIAIKIEAEHDNNKILGRHFVETDNLFSFITVKSTNILLNYFKDELSEEDLKLLDDLRNVLEIF
ncbi:translation initiation factor aIF-2 [Anncaliia algerae PRA109]|nr:translation initiation factor aIF-2 [Anncaliia algerae PRA109]